MNSEKDIPYAIALRQAKKMAIVFSGLTVMMLISFVYGFFQRKVAEETRVRFESSERQLMQCQERAIEARRALEESKKSIQ